MPRNPSPTNTIRVGVHTSISGKLANAIREAAELGCETVQIFSRNPRGWLAAPLAPEQVREFFDARERHAISPVVIHAPYLINLAAPDPTIWQRSVSAFRNEVKRAVELRADYLVVHPGSAKEQSAEFGIQACVRGIKSAVRRVKLDGLTILIENTAGQGGQIGRTFEQVGEILAGLDGLPVGCCLDTAHTYAAGYDIATKAGLEETVSLIERHVGLKRISVIHANDTKVPLGGRVDRHWHIGEGNLGLKAFRDLVNHPALTRLPFILETPKQTPDDDPRNIAALKKLVA
jgi:deoxyribonuclease-4